MSTGTPEKLGVFSEDSHPRVEVGCAVVAMHHSHEAAVGCGHHVNHLVRLAQLFLKHNHGERRCAGRDISGALFHSVGCCHAGSRVTFRRTHRHTGFQSAGDVEPLSAFFGEASGFLSRHKHLRKNLFESPAEALVGNQFVKLLDHVLAIVLGFGVNRNHARTVAYANHLLACELPVDVAGESG